MSHKVVTLVYGKQVGSMSRKAVLAYFADRASDDGSGIWTAKQRIADEIECSKQTVITTIRGLIEDGLVREVGHVANRNGYTVEYALILEAIKKLPETVSGVEGARKPRSQNLDRSTSLTARSQTALPKPSCNPLTPEDADASSPPKGSKRPAPVDPGEWSVPLIEDLPNEIGSIARQWPVGAYRTQAEGHRAWLASQRRRRDPDRSWQARIIQLGALPCRDAKAGLRSDGGRPPSAVPDLVGKSRGSRAEDLERQAEMFDRMGRPDDAVSYRRMAAVARGG